MANLQDTTVVPSTALTDAASIVTDANVGRVSTVTITANRILANPLNMVPNQTFRWFVTQGAGGSKLLTYGTAFKWVGGVAPVLSTVAGRVDMLTAYTPDGITLYASGQINFA